MDFGLDVAAEGSAVSPGILRFYYEEHSKFTTIQTPPASPTNPEDAVVISTAHVPATTADGFRIAYISQEKSEFEMEGVGDADGKSTKAVVKVFIPGDKKQLLNFVYRNPKLLGLVEKSPCGGSEYYQIGSKCTPAKIMSWKFMTKKLDGNESKGMELEIGCTMDRPLLYTATIPVPTA